MGIFQFLDGLFQRSDLGFQLGGVHGGHADGQGQLALGSLIVGGFGGDDLDGDGGADENALIDGDLHTVYGVALAGQDGKGSGIKGVIQRGGLSGQLQHIAGHDLIQGAFQRNGGLALLNFEGAGAGEVTSDGDGGGAHGGVVGMGDDAAKFCRIEGEAAVDGDHHLGGVGLAGVEELGGEVHDLHSHGCGGDDQLVFKGGILIVGRTAYHHQHPVSAGIGGCALQGAAVLQIADGDKLLLQAGGPGNSDGLGIKIEGGVQILHRNVRLGEGGLFDGEGQLHLAGVVALTDNPDGILSTGIDIVFGINANVVMFVADKLHAANRNGNVVSGVLRRSVVGRVRYRDHIGGDLCRVNGEGGGGGDAAHGDAGGIGAGVGIAGVGDLGGSHADDGAGQGRHHGGAVVGLALGGDGDAAAVVTVGAGGGDGAAGGGIGVSLVGADGAAEGAGAADPVMGGAEGNGVVAVGIGHGVARGDMGGGVDGEGAAGDGNFAGYNTELINIKGAAFDAHLAAGLVDADVVAGEGAAGDGIAFKAEYVAHNGAAFDPGRAAPNIQRSVRRFKGAAGDGQGAVVADCLICALDGAGFDDQGAGAEVGHSSAAVVAGFDGAAAGAVHQGDRRSAPDPQGDVVVAAQGLAVQIKGKGAAHNLDGSFGGKQHIVQQLHGGAVGGLGGGDGLLQVHIVGHGVAIGQAGHGLGAAELTVERAVLFLEAICRDEGCIVGHGALGIGISIGGAGANAGSIYLVAPGGEYGGSVGADGLAEGVAQQVGNLAGGELGGGLAGGQCVHGAAVIQANGIAGIIVAVKVAVRHGAAGGVFTQHAADVGISFDGAGAVAACHGAFTVVADHAANLGISTDAAGVVAACHGTGNVMTNHTADISGLRSGHLTGVVAVHHGAFIVANHTTDTSGLRIGHPTGVVAVLHGAVIIANHTANIARSAKGGTDNTYVHYFAAHADAAKEADIFGFAIVKVQISDGMVLTVKGAGVLVADIADGGPMAGAIRRGSYRNIRGQLGVCAHVACVDICREPIELAGIVDFVIAVAVQGGHFVAVADVAEAVGAFSKGVDAAVAQAAGAAALGVPRVVAGRCGNEGFAYIKACEGIPLVGNGDVYCH